MTFLSFPDNILYMKTMSSCKQISFSLVTVVHHTDDIQHIAKPVKAMKCQNRVNTHNFLICNKASRHWASRTADKVNNANFFLLPGKLPSPRSPQAPNVPQIICLIDIRNIQAEMPTGDPVSY